MNHQSLSQGGRLLSILVCRLRLPLTSCHSFLISASGPQTVEVVLTPMAMTAVPEPSTFTLGLIGVIAGVGYCARWLRRQG